MRFWPLNIYYFKCQLALCDTHIYSSIYMPVFNRKCSKLLKSIKNDIENLKIFLYLVSNIILKLCFSCQNKSYFLETKYISSIKSTKYPIELSFKDIFFIKSLINTESYKISVFDNREMQYKIIILLNISKELKCLLIFLQYMFDVVSGTNHCN